MDGADVAFQHVSKRYDARDAKKDGGAPAAVEDLSLVVPAGEICVLVGPSGCGKTTSLKMVNRLVEPTSGQVLIDGQDVATVEPTELRRRIGYVIQQVGLFPHQTIGENVATVPKLLGWPAGKIRARVDELITLVGLDPARVRGRYPSQLSGGERQRIGVARALAAEPPVLLMDEPFGAVDPIVRERLQNEFLRIHRQLRPTVLFVTHDIDEAIKLGHRVAVMQQGGHLAQYAPPMELLAHPASAFVARFVGADRGLKRLSLMKVADVALEQAPTVTVGQAASAARAAAGADPFVLLLDGERRALGWVNLRRAPDGPLSTDLADPSSPLLTLDTTLRDALAQLLSDAVQTGVVVDDAGRYLGVVGVDTIGLALRSAAGSARAEATA